MAVMALTEALAGRPADDETTLLLADAYLLAGALEEAATLVKPMVADARARLRPRWPRCTSGSPGSRGSPGIARRSWPRWDTRWTRTRKTASSPPRSRIARKGRTTSSWP